MVLGIGAAIVGTAIITGVGAAYQWWEGEEREKRIKKEREKLGKEERAAITLIEEAGRKEQQRNMFYTTIAGAIVTIVFVIIGVILKKMW